MPEPHGESLGGIILHHVTNDLNHTFLNLSLLGVNISITKHVVMIWIAAALTVGLAIWGTRRYRKDINSQPAGISHIFEIFNEFHPGRYCKSQYWRQPRQNVDSPYNHLFYFYTNLQFFGYDPIF